MAFGAILGQTVDAFTKTQTYSSGTQALYPSGTDTPDDVLALLSKAALYKTVGQAAGLYDVSDNLLLKLPGVQIATGSYVGTGTAGSSNPNSLTFDFIPKVLIVQAYDRSSFNAGLDDFLNFAIMVNGISLYMGVRSDSNVSSKSVSVTWNGNTVSWYSTTSNAMSQLNSGSEKYFYVAFG